MKAFYLTLAISLLLIIGGFLLPPMGIIDSSVLTAVGELLMFGVLAQVPTLIDAAKNGKSVKISKGDFSAEVSASDDWWLITDDLHKGVRYLCVNFGIYPQKTLMVSDCDNDSDGLIRRCQTDVIRIYSIPSIILCVSNFSRRLVFYLLVSSSGAGTTADGIWGDCIELAQIKSNQSHQQNPKVWRYNKCFFGFCL